MSAASTPIVVQEAPHSSGVSMDTIVKLIPVVIVIIIIISVVHSFQSISKVPGLQNLADAFNSITGAVAFASSHWYLVLAAFLLAPMLPGAYKYAAEKMGAALKTNSKPAVLEGVSDGIIYRVTEARLSEAGISQEERAKLQERQAEAKARYENMNEEDRKEADAKMDEIGVEHPPVKKAVLAPASASSTNVASGIGSPGFVPYMGPQHLASLRFGPQQTAPLAAAPGQAWHPVFANFAQGGC